MNFPITPCRRPHLQMNHSAVSFSRTSVSSRPVSGLQRQGSRWGQKKKQGVSLQRNKRISIDLLYDPAVFKGNSAEESGKMTSSTLRTSWKDSSKSEVTSRQTLGGSTPSGYRARQSESQLQLQSEIREAYYTPALEITKKQAKTAKNSNPLAMYRKYNLTGIIKY